MLKVPERIFSITTYLLRCLVGSKEKHMLSHLQMALDECSSPEEVILLPPVTPKEGNV